MGWKIYKYQIELEPGTRQTVLLPDGAIFKKASHQGDKVSMWFEVNTDSTVVPYEFVIKPTGGSVIPSSEMYLDTFFSHQMFVWHLYIKLPPMGVSS